MEVALVASFLNTFLPKLREVLKDRNHVLCEIEGHLEFIKEELELLAIDADSNENSTSSEKVRKLIEKARKLARNTEDCIYLYVYPQTSSSRLCPEVFLKKIEKYREKIEKLSKKLPSPKDTDNKPQDRHVEPSCLVTDGSTLGVLRYLVKKSSGQPEAKRRVISIVGFGGIGKTLLAKQVHDDSGFSPPFCSRAWVFTSSCKDAKEVLEEILKQVDPDSLAKRKKCDNLGELLANSLRPKKYLIVLDGMRTTELWDEIESAFPESVGESRVIVTTTIQSVAKYCSSSNCYVYKVPPLDKENAAKLFLQKPHPTLKFSEAAEILKKCEGVPLAVVSMSEFWKTQKSSIDALSELGAYLLDLGDSQIQSPKRIQQMLMKKYTSLSSLDAKACLLYFGMFPCDQPTSRNSVIRRWLAEGFVASEPRRSPQRVAGRQLDDLIDRNIIQSVEADTNGNVKRCRPHGIMLEYISYKSTKENFAAMMPPADPALVRRLFLHQKSGVQWVSGIQFLRVRTLAVSGSAREDIMVFDKYHLLGVLDLKDCDNQFNTKQLQDICKLLLLKYLSLGNLPATTGFLRKNKKRLTKKELPREIGNLELLETLEVRRNDEPVGVYEEIIKLRKLKHLIGKFELLDQPSKDLENFMSDNSVLETLSGFVIGKSKGFPQLMGHMSQLRKVKIWCDANAAAANMKHTSSSIKTFAGRGMERGDDNRTLSIDFVKYSAEVMESLQDSGSLGSLKLRGDLKQFPPSPPQQKFITKMKGVQEVCLSSTNLTGDAILAALSELDVLKYLKLVEDNLGSLTLTKDTMKGLERLCLVCLPKLEMTINDEALLGLVSLHILCEALAGVLPAGVKFGSLKKLNEIALLDSAGVTREVKKGWEKSAMDHPNRPDVLFIKKAAPQVQSVPPAPALPNGSVQTITKGASV